MRKKENSFLRLRFCEGRNGGENRNLNLILREGMFCKYTFFLHTIYFPLFYSFVGETRSKWHRKRTLFLIKNKVRIRLYFVVFFCRARKRIFAPNGNFGLPLNIICRRTIKIFPKGQKFFLSPFSFPFLFSPIFLLSFPLQKKRRKKKISPP